MAFNMGPDLNGRILDKITAQMNHVKVIVQIFPLPAMLSSTSHADSGNTLPPLADASYIFTGWICKKHIGSAILVLRSAHQPS